MFFGSIPGAVRSVIDEQVKDWRAEQIWVGCSGNFTIERVLARHGRFRLVGNDVTIYSCALGAYFAGEDFPVSLRPEYAEEWGLLADYLQDAESVAATILVLSQIAVGLNKDNAYYRRVKAGIKRQWPALHARTVARLRALDLHLAGFWRGEIDQIMAGHDLDRRIGTEFFPTEEADWSAMPRFAADHWAADRLARALQRRGFRIVAHYFTDGKVGVDISTERGQLLVYCAEGERFPAALVEAVRHLLDQGVGKEKPAKTDDGDGRYG